MEIGHKKLSVIWCAEFFLDSDHLSDKASSPCALLQLSPGTESTARQKYYKHIKKAKQNPDNYLSLIIDSMDQNKTFLPHFSTLRKSKSSLKPMKFHLTGVLAHGQNRAFIYGWTPKFHMDTNITVNVLVGVLQELAKVKLGYLMPGHTHEDVDQLFSRISLHLQHNDATTLPELFQAIKTSYKPVPECRFMTSMWDFKTQIDQKISGISGHSRPHQYVAKMIGGKVHLSAQLWPTKEQPKVPISCSTFIPTFPQLSSVKQWKFDPNDDAVKLHDVMVRNVKNDLVKWSETVRVNDEFIPWWEKFLNLEKKEPGKPVWQLSALKKYRPQVFADTVLTEESRALLDKYCKKSNDPLKIVLKGKGRQCNRKRKLESVTSQKKSVKRKRN
ncbi:hypothetical protein Bbelb_322870 [Branchiostoma belcheri]|nr:hypothetical protein Bbelb_322870 [Branchiostoma belcheri]